LQHRPLARAATPKFGDPFRCRSGPDVPSPPPR
jgi:hypothetical protein